MRELSAPKAGFWSRSVAPLPRAISRAFKNLRRALLRRSPRKLSKKARLVLVALAFLAPFVGVRMWLTDVTQRPSLALSKLTMTALGNTDPSSSSLDAGTTHRPASAKISNIVIDSELLSLAQKITIENGVDTEILGERPGETSRPIGTAKVTIDTRVSAPDPTQQVTLLQVSRECEQRVSVELLDESPALVARIGECISGEQARESPCAECPAKFEVHMRGARVIDPVQTSATASDTGTHADAGALADAAAHADAGALADAGVHHVAPPVASSGVPAAGSSAHVDGTWGKETKMTLSLKSEQDQTRRIIASPVAITNATVTALEAISFHPSRWAVCEAAAGEEIELFGSKMTLRSLSHDGRSKLTVELRGVEHCGVMSYAHAFWQATLYWIVFLAGLGAHEIFVSRWKEA